MWSVVRVARTAVRGDLTCTASFGCCADYFCDDNLTYLVKVWIIDFKVIIIIYKTFLSENYSISSDNLLHRVIYGGSE